MANKTTTMAMALAAAAFICNATLYVSSGVWAQPDNEEEGECGPITPHDATKDDDILSQMKNGGIDTSGGEESQATSGQTPTIELHRQIDEGGVDAPSGLFKLRLLPSGLSNGQPDQPPPEGATPPAEPEDPSFNPESDDQTYYGEKIGTTFVWVLDYSNSMDISDIAAVEDNDGNIVSNPKRIDILKIECLKVLIKLDENYAFDIVKLAGVDHPGMGIALPVTKSWRGELVPATQANIRSAMKFVNTEDLQAGTPTWTALNTATHYDFADGGSLHVLTDGAPTNGDYPGAPGTRPWENRSAQNIVLRDFAEWFKPLQEKNVALHVIQIGLRKTAGEFCQRLAAENGGTFTHIR